MMGLVEAGFQAVEAMPRWAHGTSFTNRWMNRAAVIEPPWRVPTFFMSATWLSSCFSYWAGIGMRHSGSPLALEAARRLSAKVSLLLNKPAMSLPSETMIAPVRVARSTMNLGLKLSLIHISEPTRQAEISYAVF